MALAVFLRYTCVDFFYCLGQGIASPYGLLEFLFMSREFILDEPATSLAEMLRECLVDLLCNTSGDELSIEDKTYLGYVKQAWQKYQKTQRKLKKEQNTSLKNQAAASSNEKTQLDKLISEFKSVDELSSDNSTLCDHTDLAFAIQNLDFPRSRDAIKKQLNAMFDDLTCLEILTEFTPYLHLFCFANNRTIVKCSPLEIGDEILLNTSDLLTKLPAWNLCLDLNGCTMANSAGEKITGLSIMRTPFGLGANTLKTDASKKGGPRNGNKTAKSAEQDLVSDGFTLMLCTNNLCYSAFEYSMPIDPEFTVLDALHESMFLDEEDQNLVAALKKEAQEQGTEFATTTVQTEDETIKLLCPEDVYAAVKEALKYVCYVLTHLDQVKDEQGNVAVFKNIDLIDLQPNKSLSALGSRDLPIVTYTL